MFIILYGVWFLFLTTYFLIKKIKDLRVITFSMLLILFLSVTGPWNIFRFCKKNQTQRLINIAKAENIWVNEKINAKNKIISDSAQSEISNIAYYLVTTHGHTSIKNFFPTDVDSIFKINSYYSNIYSNLEQIFKSAGLNFAPYRYGLDDYNYQYFYTETTDYAINTSNSTFLCIFNLYFYSDSVSKVNHYSVNDTLSITLKPNFKDGTITIIANNQEDATLWIDPFYNYLKELKPAYTIQNNAYKPEQLKAFAEGKKYTYTFYFSRIEFQLGKEKPATVTSASGTMLASPVNK